MQKLSPKMKNVLETVGSFLSTFVTTIVAIVAILFVLVKLLGWNLFSVDSGSMSPLYPIDTLVVVQSIDPEEIEVGDVITYVLNEDGVLVTHRVVSINAANRTFTTKGDANNSEDAPVLWDNVVGKVFLGLPKIGKLIRWLTDAENRPVVIAVIAALFLGSFVWDVSARRGCRRVDKHDRTKNERAADGFEEP